MKIFNKNTKKDPEYRHEEISKNLDKNILKISEMLGYSPDLKKRIFFIDEDKEIRIAVLYMNGIVDQMYINETIIDGMINNYKRVTKDKKYAVNFNFFKDFIITVTELEDYNKYGELFLKLLGGDTIVLIDGLDKYFVLGSRKYTERAVSEPTTHVSILGPKDSFTENILTNINLIRKRIKNPNLWYKHYVIGKETNTDVCVMYLNNIADEKLVTEVINRIKNMEIENILDSSYIEYMIKDKNFCLFPTLWMSERPDIIASNILEGRVAILVDGTPFVLVAPTVFIQFIQSVEDFYIKSYVATFYRILRMLAVYITIFLPGMYVSLIGLHAELLPIVLLIRIAGQRGGLPFPASVEAILMTLIFDLLREASVRVPSLSGTAVTIAGALVLGQSAVEAGIISPVMVVVVSVTALTTLIIPNYRMQIQISILKYGLLILASTFGIYGITIGVILFFTHLCSIRSFGVNYYSPYAPFSLSGQKDSLYKAPLKKVYKRPKNFTEKYPN